MAALGTNIVESFLNQVDDAGDNFVENAYASIGTELSALLTTLFVLYVAWWGILVITGRAPVSIGEVVFKVSRMALIYTVAMNWSVFNTLVYSWASEVPENLGTLLMANLSSDASGFDGGPSQGLSNFYHASTDAAGAIASKGGVRNVGAYLIAILTFVAAMLLLAISIAIITFAKVVFWILLALAPLAIAAALFDQTRRFFDGWMGSAVTHFLIPIIVYAVLGLFVSLTTQVVTELNSVAASDDISLTNVAPFVLICLVGCFVIWQLPVIAQSIGGGFATSAQSMGAWVKGAASSSIRTMGNGAGKLSRAGRLSVDRMRTNASQIGQGGGIVVSGASQGLTATQASMAKAVRGS